MIGRLRAVRLVAMREILERGRSRGYLLSLLFTVILLGAGFVLPALLLGQEKSPKLALVDPVPAGLQAAIEGDRKPVQGHARRQPRAGPGGRRGRGP